MELWIRSQDRERLTICRDLRIYKSLEKDEWCIEDCDWLGSYKTKERALEVLDEIEQIIISKEIYLNDREAFDEGLANYDLEDRKELLKQTFIYEMPNI